jgi:transposase
MRGTEKRRRRTKQERRQIVEATIGTGVSVARVARAHGVNANQVYAWRRLYEKGLLGPPGNQVSLVPVRVTDAIAADGLPGSGSRRHPQTTSGSIQIEFAKARLHVEGAPEPSILRIVLECLLG